MTNENDKKTDNPNVVAFPPMIYLVTLILGLILNYLFPMNFSLPRLPFFIVGLLLILTAGTLAFRAFRVMNLRKTNVNPNLPTTAIVSDDVFSFSRNPIYLSLTLLYIGFAFLFNSIWSLLLLLPLLAIMIFGVILREEIYLEKKFGDEYLDYKKKVRRWI